MALEPDRIPTPAGKPGPYATSRIRKGRGGEPVAGAPQTFHNSVCGSPVSGAQSFGSVPAPALSTHPFGRGKRAGGLCLRFLQRI